MPYAWPVNPAFTPVGGGFGSWTLDNGARRTVAHSGVDWARNAGEAIRAAHGGVVKYVRKESTSGWGRFVWIQGDDGKFYGYAHMRDIPLVNVGQRVEVGTLLGYVGATGNVTGAHLHFVVAAGTWEQAFALVFATLIDPVAYISARLDPLLPHERQVKPDANVNVRVDPSPTAREIAEIGPNQQFTPVGYKPDGAIVSGVSLWYTISVPAEKDADEVAWVWGGGCTEASGHDLPLYAPPAPPAPAPIVHLVTFNNGELSTVGVAEGERIPSAAVPTPIVPDGYRFTGWTIDDVPIDSSYVVRAPVTIDVRFEPIPTSPDPEEPPVPEPTPTPAPTPAPPLVQPDIAKLEEALATLGKQAAPFIPKPLRKKIYGRVKWAAGAAGAIGVTGLAVAPVVGGEVGAYIATGSAIATILGTALGALAVALADENTDTSLDA